MTTKDIAGGVLAAVVAGAIIYAMGYCRGDAHGGASAHAKALAARVDTLRRRGDSLATVVRHDRAVLDSAHARTIRDSLALAHAAEHVRVVDRTHVAIVTGPGATPRMDTIPVEVGDLLAAQAARIASLERALNAAYIVIDTQRQQLAASDQRAAALDSLYRIERAKHSGPGFTAGLIAGGLLGLLALLLGR